MTIHETYIDINGVLTLANADDPHYEQKFATATEFFDFARQLITAGNAHFGTTVRLIDATEELNITLCLDGVKIKAGDYPPINFDDKSYRNVADELSPLHIFGEENMSQIRQDYTWADHQAANQATLNEIAAAMGLKR